MSRPERISSSALARSRVRWDRRCSWAACQTSREVRGPSSRKACRKSLARSRCEGSGSEPAPPRGWAAVGELGQGVEHAADAPVAGTLDGLVEESHDRVDDEQACLGQSDGLVEQVHLGGQTERAGGTAVVAVEDEDAVEVSAQTLEAR